MTCKIGAKPDWTPNRYGFRVPSVISRAQVVGFRIRAQQLDRDTGSLDDTIVLNLGVQDTGPDGGLWALMARGVDVTRVGDMLSTVWALRAAPHLYLRDDLSHVAAAVSPVSDADANKRIFDAAKPLKAAGIGGIAALDAAAAAMRAVVTKPMLKGEVSTRMTAVMDAPYLRNCGPCETTHMYENTFRLAALRGGLELQPGTSPPVLQRNPQFRTAVEVPQRLDVVRTYLHLLGPATPKQVAEYVDSPVKVIEGRWPSDVVDVTVDGERRSVLAADVDAFGSGVVRTVRLLGPFDPFLQAKDRSTLVPDPARMKQLWPTLGRPGGVLVDGDIVGVWRPRKSGSRLSVEVGLWDSVPKARRDAIAVQAERLAAFRHLALSGVHFVD